MRRQVRGRGALATCPEGHNLTPHEPVRPKMFPIPGLPWPKPFCPMIAVLKTTSMNKSKDGIQSSLIRPPSPKVGRPTDPSEEISAWTSWFQIASPEGATLRRQAREPLVPGSVRFLEQRARRLVIPKIDRFHAFLARRLPKTDGNFVRRRFSHRWRRSVRRHRRTCPIGRKVSPPNNVLEHRSATTSRPVRSVNQPESRSTLVLVPEGSATRTAPGKPVVDPPNQTTIWCLDRGESIRPKADPSSTIACVIRRASTPHNTDLGTFAAQSEDRPAGQVTRKQPAPGSGIPTIA